jgi:hypothetical protein
LSALFELRDLLLARKRYAILSGTCSQCVIESVVASLKARFLDAATYCLAFGLGFFDASFHLFARWKAGLGTTCVGCGLEFVGSAFGVDFIKTGSEGGALLFGGSGR